MGEKNLSTVFMEVVFDLAAKQYPPGKTAKSGAPPYNRQQWGVAAFGSESGIKTIQRLEKNPTNLKLDEAWAFARSLGKELHDLVYDAKRRRGEEPVVTVTKHKARAGKKRAANS